MSLLGLDVGTSGCKALVFQEDDSILAFAAATYPLLTSPNGWLELDPVQVWSAVSGCVQRVNAQVTSDPVKAMAVSVLGEAVIPVGNKGEPLGLSPVSFDGRAAPQAESFRATFGDDAAYTITGQPVHPMYSIHKIVWWRDEQPALFRDVWKFLCYGDYVVHKLGLPPAIDYSMAARTQAFDIRSKQWAPAILEWAGITPDRLAEPVPAASTLGCVDRRVGEALGFVGDVQVVAGGHDQPCGALGAGALDAGDGMYALGTTACIAPTLPRPLLELAQDGFPCYPHVIPGSYVTLAGIPSGGSLLRWFRDVFGDREVQAAEVTGRSVYDVMVEQVTDEPGHLVLLPHFAGTEAPYHDPQAQGAIFGLTLSTTRGDVIKAILEGIALEMASYVSHLHRAGVELRTLRAVGGGAQSARWMQINADIIGLPIAVPKVTEATCLGAGLLAGYATGCYDSLAEAVAQVIAIGPTFEPRKERVDFFGRRLSEYERIYPAIGRLNLRLAQRQDKS